MMRIICKKRDQGQKNHMYNLFRIKLTKDSKNFNLVYLTIAEYFG